MRPQQLPAPEDNYLMGSLPIQEFSIEPIRRDSRLGLHCGRVLLGSLEEKAMMQLSIGAVEDCLPEQRVVKHMSQVPSYLNQPDKKVLSFYYKLNDKVLIHIPYWSFFTRLCYYSASLSFLILIEDGIKTDQDRFRWNLALTQTASAVQFLYQLIFPNEKDLIIYPHQWFAYAMFFFKKGYIPSHKSWSEFYVVEGQCLSHPGLMLDQPTLDRVLH